MRFSVCDCVSAMRSLVSGARCPVASDVWSPPGGVEEHLSAQFLWRSTYPLCPPDMAVWALGVP